MTPTYCPAPACNREGEERQPLAPLFEEPDVLRCSCCGTDYSTVAEEPAPTWQPSVQDRFLAKVGPFVWGGRKP
jgi:hypothetical protein